MRLDYQHELPEASRAMAQLERVVDASTLEPSLRELVKLRARVGDRDARDRILAELATATGAELVQRIGYVAL